MTLKQEPQPSSSSSKIEPIPLNIQPKIPPPVKTMSNKTRIPMIANISIYSQKKQWPMISKKYPQSVFVADWGYFHFLQLLNVVETRIRCLLCLTVVTCRFDCCLNLVCVT